MATIEALLDVAERQFAEMGVQNVPLTRIATVTGQRNRSVMQYHFGSREGLLKAVLDRRLAVVNALRSQLLDEAEQRPLTLESLLRAAIAPLGIIVIEQPWGADYVSIVAEVIGRLQRVRDHGVDDRNLSALRRSRALMQTLLRDLPAEVLEERDLWLNDSIVLAVARWVRDTPAEGRTREHFDALLIRLTAYSAAALRAPAPPSSPQSS